DSMRPPMLKIEKIEHEYPETGRQQAFRHAVDELQERVERYLDVSGYNASLHEQVTLFAQVVDKWLAHESNWQAYINSQAHAEKSPEEVARYQQHNVALGEFLQALDALALGEQPIHSDIAEGQQASMALQVSAVLLILYLLMLIILFQRSTGKKLYAAFQGERQARHDLAEREQYLSLTLNSIGDAIIATDVDGCITRMNPVAEQLTGWPENDARHKPLKQVFHIVNAMSRELVTDPVEKVLEHGRIVGLANHTVLIARDGQEYQIADSAAPIRSETGEILGVILVFRDVTQQYLTEEALRRSQKMEAIGQLTGGIAHDFNNQLGITVGYLDFLKKHVGNEEKPARWVDAATKATERCITLTRQLLNFSRSRGGEKRVVDINAVLQEMEGLVARSVTSEVTVQTFLADELWLTEVDPGELQDAVLNLVINARHAMPDGGNLLIETSNKYLDEGYAAINPEVTAGEYVQLMLSDTGAGMDRKTLEHVFEPFFTTKEKGKGTGLGMAMVYGFAKRYGGYIKIYSEPGHGTTVRLYFPRSVSSGATDQLDSAAETDLPRGDETVLIVDDETDLLDLAEQYLAELGYRTCRAENGTEALSVLAANKNIDLLFSDVVMPGGMNGYELANQATKQQAGLKVLLTSGFTSKTIAHNGLARFSAHLLSKPYRMADLAKRIRLVLDETAG
ncbi:MAG TPA: response regulator, partial [Thiotrichales bacterium]|nr:response regulator [Thiotrichales bacterium]